MGEFGRTSLLMLAASIGTEDEWVMAASSGAITLTPLRMMSGDEQRSSMDRGVVLRLTDLEYLESTESQGAMRATASPLRTSSTVVLLLPWSLLATVARLDALARTTSAVIPSCYAPEDWLTATHHFLDVGDWSQTTLKEDFTTRMTALHGNPAKSRSHFVFASFADATSGPVLSLQDGRGSRVTSVAEGVSVDPLMYTNPGSQPEGLGPLFMRGEGQEL